VIRGKLCDGEMSRIINYKKNMVAFQGEPGAFSEQAAKKFFGSGVKVLPCRSFEDVFESVARKRALHGIIPIENALFGSIHQNYDLLQQYDIPIIGEIKLRIVHALLAPCGVKLKDIRKIYSHPQALGQCDLFVRTLKHAEAVAAYDTAGAAKAVKEQKRKDSAAIASVDAAKVYGLQILRRGIENDHRNFTRFLVISKRKPLPSRNAKTSIVVSMNNVPGALFRALSVFALRDIDLYKIESRPLVGKPWEYLFYIDFEGSVNNERSAQALRHLREITATMKILGSYPHGKTVGGPKS